MSTVPMKAIRRPVLTARWSNLAILTYETPPALLEPHLPAGLALDTRGGTAFASLVAFDFLDTRVLGVPWPGFRDFPELHWKYGYPTVIAVCVLASLVLYRLFRKNGWL